MTEAVLSNSADDDRLSPQGCDVVPDVGGPPQPMGLVHRIYDGNRGLWRDALGVSPEISIEHEVAHDQDLAAGQSR